MKKNQLSTPAMISNLTLWEELNDEKQAQISGGSVGVGVTVDDKGVGVGVKVGDIEIKIKI